MIITKGMRVRCELESQGRTVEIEGRVEGLQGSRFAEVSLGLGGATISLPTADLEPLSAEVIPFGRRLGDTGFWIEPGPGAAA